MFFKKGTNTNYKYRNKYNNNNNNNDNDCELISLHGLYLEEQGTRSAAGSVFRRGNGSLSEPLAKRLMDRS